MELRLELGAVIRLHDVDAARNGKRRTASSMNWMAVRWVHAS
jgi:hypothetical protein